MDTAFNDKLEDIHNRGKALCLELSALMATKKTEETEASKLLWLSQKYDAGGVCMKTDFTPYEHIITVESRHLVSLDQQHPDEPTFGPTCFLFIGVETKQPG